MKSKRNIMMMASIGLFLLFILFVGWINLSPSKVTYSKEQLMKEIEEQYDEVKVAQILDISYLDEKHVFVPFMTEENEYGMSLWVRKFSKWHCGQILLNYSVMKWKIGSNDYFIWNVPLRNESIKLNLYLLRDRQYRVSDGDIYYSPAVQMEEEISIDSKSFGYRKINEEWIAVKDEHNHQNESRISFMNFQQYENLYYGYQLKNRKDEAYPIEFFSSKVFSGRVSIDVEDVLFISNEELQLTE